MVAAAQGRITYRPVAIKPVPFKFIYLLGQMRIFILNDTISEQ